MVFKRVIQTRQKTYTAVLATYMLTTFRGRTPFPMKGTPLEPYPPHPRSNNCCRGGGGCQKHHFHKVLDPVLFSHCLRCANVWLCNGVGVDREREREWRNTRSREEEERTKSGSKWKWSNVLGVLRALPALCPARSDRPVHNPAGTDLRNTFTAALLCSPVLSCPLPDRDPSLTIRVDLHLAPAPQHKQTTALTPRRSGSCREERKNLL